MAEGGRQATLRYVDTLFRVGTVGALSDGELLDRFTSGLGEAAEAAFAALVERHGPMVLRVCRSVLHDGHEAQDAFQAAFFVLARKAHSVQRRDSVASWLYGVAYRVSSCARAASARRRRHERQAAERRQPSVTDEPSNDLGPLLHEELSRLPDALRAPVVLCYVEGLTHDQAALQLRWPVGTVRSRLARARDRLRQRLARRGISADEATFAGALAADAVPRALLEATIRGSLGFAAKGGAAAAVGSATATALARGALHAMTISKYAVLGSGALVCALAFTGAQAFAWQYGGMGGMGGSGGFVPDRQAAERQAAALRSVDRMQGELVEAARRNAELQRELQALRNEIQALRSGAGAPPADGPGAEPPRPEEKKTVTEPAPAPAPAAGSRALAKRSAPAKRGVPLHMQQGRSLIVVAPDGDKVASYDTQTGQSAAVTLNASKKEPLKVRPIVGPGVGALMISGDHITRIAACSLRNGPGFNQGPLKWYPFDLREPVKGEAMPVLGPGVVVYGLGRFIYSFSDTTKRWEVLELPEAEGSKAIPIVGPGSITVETDGHQYSYSAQSGKWQHIDFRALLESAQPDDAEPHKDQPSGEPAKDRERP